MEQSINMIKYKGNDNMFKVLKTTSLSVCGAVPLGARILKGNRKPNSLCTVSLIESELLEELSSSNRYRVALP